MLVFFTVSSTLRSLRSKLKATECEKPSLLHRELTQLGFSLPVSVYVARQEAGLSNSESSDSETAPSVVETSVHAESQCRAPSPMIDTQHKAGGIVSHAGTQVSDF